MAGTTKDYSVSEIIQGPGDLWAIGVAPTDSAVRLTLASDGSPDQTTHPGSVHLGVIMQAVSTTIKPKIAAISTDQFEAPIDSYLTELDGKIEAELGQVESQKLQRMLGVGTYSSGTNANPAAGTAYEQVTFGGTFTVPKICLACISPSRQNPNQYVVSVLFIGVSMGGFALALGRAKAASYKAQFQGLSDPTRTVGQQIGVLYQTLANASGGTPTPRANDPSQIFQGPVDLYLISPAPTDATQQVTLDAATLTPSSTVHPNSMHLGLIEGATTFSVAPKIDAIKADQFDGAVDAYLNSLACKIETTCLNSTMQNLARALGVGNYTISAGNYAQCTFGGTNQPPTICIAAIAQKRVPQAASTTLAAAIGAPITVPTAISLNANAAPNGEYLKIDSEWFVINSGGGTTTPTVTGGQLGSTAATHLINATVSFGGPTKVVVACLYRVNAADGISWTAQRTKTSTFKVTFTGQSDVTRTAGRQIGIWHETM
jgi:hypothetical protein